MSIAERVRACLLIGLWSACSSSGSSDPTPPVTSPTAGSAGQASAGKAGSLPMNPPMAGATGGGTAGRGTAGALAAGSGAGGASGMSGAAGAGGISSAGSSGGAAPSGGALMGACPDGFVPKEGKNSGFSSGGKMRDFHVWPSMTGEGPRPLFLALTGTVQEEVAFAMQSGLRQLPADGWIVVSPVRSCSQEGRNCSTVGSDGRIWEPWFDGTARPSTEGGPDVAFVEAVIECVATVWPVAADKIYAGGISAGGSFTNRNLTFNSRLFAGGVPASGNWTYGVPPDPPMPMERSIAIVIWGGPTDEWPGSPPYSGETKAAAMYYAAQANVVTVACSGTHGHSWPAAMTPWIASTLLSHPKGSEPASFMLPAPPAGFNCVVGAYTDH